MILKDFVEQALTRLVEAGAQREVEFELWVSPSQDGKGIEVASVPHKDLSKIKFTVKIGNKE